MDIQALAFDTGGTVLDWHGGLIEAFERVGARNGVYREWHSLANDWRRRTMKGIVGQRLPAFHMDDVHRRTLDETLAHFGLGGIGEDDRLELWRTWHRLDAWPDFPGALAAIRERLHCREVRTSDWSDPPSRPCRAFAAPLRPTGRVRGSTRRIRPRWA